MKEDKATVMLKIDPDLSVPPHVLPVLMELIGGEKQQALSQQEQLCAHLATCHYCRTALMVLLGAAQEYDRRNNNPEEPTRNLLMRFANINREIEAYEAREFERMGEFAEAIVVEGREKAAQRFPDIATHLGTCPDCSSALEATVASITEQDLTE